MVKPLPVCQWFGWETDDAAKRGTRVGAGESEGAYELKFRDDVLICKKSVVVLVLKP